MWIFFFQMYTSELFIWFTLDFWITVNYGSLTYKSYLNDLLMNNWHGNQRITARKTEEKWNLLDYLLIGQKEVDVIDYQCV